MKKALIVWGGWDRHEPKQTAEIAASILDAEGFQVEVSDTLDSFADEEKAKSMDLLVPVWTMGEINGEQSKGLLSAVRSGVGFAGWHGGAGDSFRTNTEYQFMVGGQWVAHPGGDGVHFTVHIGGVPHPITEGIQDFGVSSEHYYMHVDPGNRVLASSRFGQAVMPTVWTKMYGKGRVFYCSLGHHADIVEMPPVLTMVTRGMLWAMHEYPGS